MRLFMKKLGDSLLCCILVVSGCFLFSGCESSELDKYDELKEILFELQVNSENLYYNSIYITGYYHSENTGRKEKTSDHKISLNKLLILENAILERRSQHNNYWFYFDIETIKDSDNNVIWSKD